ncbi:alpha-L-glutamate ligase-like protein [Piscirickettsia salmonis]|uniref:alpha-L-glutamate ligase-like protein n=1 Tax=Piscirickettsia salmonis TaxID=1238 RepID=UPI000F0753D2|nr:alpha-L-glutamate ligase-like protein [Piscirickettsiaceae bacterium NZ-RLO2]
MISLWKTYQALKTKGILGINQRNADFIIRYNQRKYYPLVDDKIMTKTLAIKDGIAVPKLYASLKTDHDTHHLEQILANRTDFVIKPARGAGGDGILVITNRHGERFRKVSGALLHLNDIRHHISNILSGVYSLGGQRDQAMIEYRVQFDPLFEKISYQGVPDIRIIVLKGYPAMAMVRLPTRLSDGKANLHQGAIGVGIDLTTGITLDGVWMNDPIHEHPDTGYAVPGLQIPHWDHFLSLAARCYELTQLGYLGVDIILDKDKGPLMLELNARPGLNIQIANNSGLLHRLRFIEQQNQQRTANERIAFIKHHFAEI